MDVRCTTWEGGSERMWMVVDEKEKGRGRRGEVEFLTFFRMR